MMCCLKSQIPLEMPSASLSALFSDNVETDGSHLVYLVTQCDFGCVISEAQKTSQQTSASSSLKQICRSYVGGP